MERLHSCVAELWSYLKRQRVATSSSIPIQPCPKLIGSHTISHGNCAILNPQQSGCCSSGIYLCCWLGFFVLREICRQITDNHLCLILLVFSQPANSDAASVRGLRRIRFGEYIALRKEAAPASQMLRVRWVPTLGELGEVLAVQHGRRERRCSSEACQ